MSGLADRATVRGSGPPLLLPHGAGGPGIWDFMVGDLAESFQVIVPTFPVFRREDGLVRYSDQLYVDFLEDVRRHPGVEKWPAVGVSVGARAVLDYDVRHERRVSRLVAIGVHPGGAGPFGL